ncbi:hypothetical protein ABKN59_004738 [Abortiporus biennis]
MGDAVENPKGNKIISSPSIYGFLERRTRKLLCILAFQRNIMPDGHSPTKTTYDPMTAYSSVRRVESAHETIGRPVTFLSGQFEGKTVRTEIVELQKADLGRKYARKDRRPLDPPPVVQLKLYQVFNHGTSRETEQEMDCYDDVRGFENGRRPRQPRHKAKLNDPSSSTLPPPPSIIPAETSPTSAHPNITSAGHPQTTLYYQQSPISHRPDVRLQPFHSNSSYTLPPPIPTISSIQGHPSSSSSTSQYSYSHQNIDGGLSLPPIQIPELPSQPNGTSIYSSPESRLPHHSTSTYPPPPSALSSLPPSSIHIPSATSQTVQNEESRVVAYLGEYPITEGSKCTDALVGASFCQSATLEYQGKRVLMFVFSVRSRTHGTQDIPILAECYGGSFKIYSTKEFPGLRASTDLTKHLSFFGVRLNLRENERKRRKKVVPSSSATNTTATTADNSNAPRSLPQTQAHVRGVSRKRKSDDGDGGESQRSDDDEDGSLDGHSPWAWAEGRLCRLICLRSFTHDDCEKGNAHIEGSYSQREYYDAHKEWYLVTLAIDGRSINSTSCN